MKLKEFIRRGGLSTLLWFYSINFTKILILYETNWGFLTRPTLRWLARYFVRWPTTLWRCPTSLQDLTFSLTTLKPTCSIEFSAMYVRAVLPDPLNKFCSHSMRWTSARCILSKWCCILFGQISEWNQINAHTLAPTRKKASKNLIAASVTSKKLPNVYKSCPKWFC